MNSFLFFPFRQNPVCHMYLKMYSHLKCLLSVLSNDYLFIIIEDNRLGLQTATAIKAELLPKNKHFLFTFSDKRTVSFISLYGLPYFYTRIESICIYFVFFSCFNIFVFIENESFLSYNIILDE